MTRALRIVTLNVWNRSGPWPARAALIRRELRELDADIVGLQEILELDARSSGGTVHNQAHEIADGLGYEVVHGAASELGGPTLTMGNALLSRYPVREHHGWQLPGAEETKETRACLHAVLAAPPGPLHVFVTHLNWKLHHGSTRIRQVRDITERIARACPIGNGDPPPILMGDFNAEPESDEIRYLTGRATIDGRSIYFADAWTYAGSGPGYTFDRRNPYAALAHEPPRRLDYVFVRGPDSQLRGEPLSARLAFDRPDERGVWPSDHFGLVVELAAEPRTDPTP